MNYKKVLKRTNGSDPTSRRDWKPMKPSKGAGREEGNCGIFLSILAAETECGNRRMRHSHFHGCRGRVADTMKVLRLSV